MAVQRGTRREERTPAVHPVLKLKHKRGFSGKADFGVVKEDGVNHCNRFLLQSRSVLVDLTRPVAGTKQDCEDR